MPFPETDEMIANAIQRSAYNSKPQSAMQLLLFIRVVTATNIVVTIAKVYAKAELTFLSRPQFFSTLSASFSHSLFFSLSPNLPAQLKGLGSAVG